MSAATFCGVGSLPFTSLGCAESLKIFASPGPTCVWSYGPPEWHALHFWPNSVGPASALPAPSASDVPPPAPDDPPCAASHFAKSCWLSITALAYMRLCASPQNSVQMMRYVPARVGVTRIVVTRPGTMSALLRNSGIQKPWITSREVMWIVVGVFSGRGHCVITGFASFG